MKSPEKLNESIDQRRNVEERGYTYTLRDTPRRGLALAEAPYKSEGKTYAYTSGDAPEASIFILFRSPTRVIPAARGGRSNACSRTACDWRVTVIPSLRYAYVWLWNGARVPAPKYYPRVWERT